MNNIKEKAMNNIIMIAKDKKSCLSIAISENPSKVEKTAAEELCEYLQKATGAAFTVVSEDCVSGNAIYVGHTRYAAVCAPVCTGEEQWFIKAHNKNVVISGGRAPIERGLIYGVFHFLEDILGIRWWNEWEEYVPAVSEFYVADDLALSGEPKFKLRQISTRHCKRDLRFIARTRQSGNPNKEIVTGWALDTAQKYGGFFYGGGPHHVHTLPMYINPETYTDEVAFFIEQVTGHMIPDFQPALKHGVRALMNGIDKKLGVEKLSDKKKANLTAMKQSLQCAIVLANRYADIAKAQKETACAARKKELDLMEATLRKVPENGAETLFEAMQSYILLWQIMCLEQAPNPFAFSVGNADRIFEPYRAMEKLSREESAALFKHFLVFFNVGERSWAISQNILVSGKDADNCDLTNEMTYAILDAYYDMNLPQPILSVKVHSNTPEKLYKELGRFFFTPGCLTPSLFNDDSLFETLRENGIEEEDLQNYSVAGCQEPLIMGKDNANTTNSWLNMGKVLELTLTGGISEITGKQIGPQTSYDETYILENLRPLFYKNLQWYCEKMRDAANGASRALSLLPVPFLSCFEGGLDSAIDVRDPDEQGTKYNGSGCLIHGLSIVADSFIAIDHLLRERQQDAGNLIKACKANFEGYEELRKYLKECPKYGNNIPEVDREAAEIVRRVSDMVAGLENYLGNPFRPDWSSPSTHLTYGYWVGATPDGRESRSMMGYGIDPLFSTADSGLGFRTLSTMRLPFEKMCGGCASHFGIDPKYFTAQSYEEKGMQFYNRVLKPLFFNPGNEKRAPFYLYVNITTAETLRKVLENPKKYAPNGVYIMRIHGTFVNFLDLSPEIQEDIILRLAPGSTAC